MELLERIISEEGFRERVYRDTLGVFTFGHGLTWITEDESRQIVLNRITDISRRLSIAIPCWSNQPLEVREILVEMAYQLGVSGLLEFRNMLNSIESGDYESAANHGLDSKWHRQTPERAKRTMDRLRAAK